MIWDNPIHESRPIRDWIDDSDTGFQPKIIDLVSNCDPAELVQKPPAIAQPSPIFIIDSLADVVQVASIVKAFSSYADVALWCDGTKFPRSNSRDVPTLNWTGTDVFTSYRTADILIISNIPENTSDTAYRNHRLEVDKIILSRQSRRRNITIVIGPNHTTLSSIIQYKQLDAAAKKHAGKN